METFAKVASTGTDSVKIENHEILSPFVEPGTSKTFVDCGFTRLYSRDALSNSTGSYFFEYERELLPKVHDLSTIMCEVTTSIVKMEGDEERPVEESDNVSVTNNFVDSLWSKIHMTINNAEAYSSPANRYHYVQLSRLLGHNEPLEQKGLDFLAMAQADENPGAVDGENVGFFDRAQMFVNKRKRGADDEGDTTDYDAKRLKERHAMTPEEIKAAFAKARAKAAAKSAGSPGDDADGGSESESEASEDSGG